LIHALFAFCLSAFGLWAFLSFDCDVNESVTRADLID
jgi:hypothetical protein